MKRQLTLAVAQLGPINRTTPRAQVVERLIAMLHQASLQSCRFVVFPELALTTFFPRTYFEQQSDIDHYFEREMPNASVQPLFETARQLGIGFYLGYAELTQTDDHVRRFNTSILVNPAGAIVGRYRKVHLPGHYEHEPWRPFQHLEKRYFEPGDLGFGVWPLLGARVGMCICNDRRWPETWRVMGLKGAELITLGYNTPVHYPPVPQHDHLQSFHHLLPMQSAAYQNGTYIAAAAKAGLEDGSVLLGHSCIIAPTGEIVALSTTLDDELIVANCDFNRCAEIKRHIFDFQLHRQPQHYSLISENPTPMATPAPLFNTDVPTAHVINERETQITPSAFGPLTTAKCLDAQTAIKAWPGYEPTPLYSLDGLAKRLDIQSVHYKDEAPRFGLGSFKSLGGAFAVSCVLLKFLTDKIGRPVGIQDLTSGEFTDVTQTHTVACATDGNHGRSVAWGAERFGCQCVIYIHADVSDGRKQAIEHYGATVIRVDGNYDDSVRRAAEDAERLGYTVVSDTSYEGYLDIPTDVMRGYTLLADEAIDQLGEIQPTHVLLQGGVGGFAAAVAVRIRDRLRQTCPRITVVEPDKAACIYESVRQGQPTAVHGELDTIMAGLACGEVSVVAFDILRALIDDVVVLPDESAIHTMRLLADGVDGDPPIVAGESAVAGLATVIIGRDQEQLGNALKLDSASRVLVIGTEGATDPDLYHTLVGRSAQAVAAT